MQNLVNKYIYKESAEFGALIYDKERRIRCTLGFIYILIGNWIRALHIEMRQESSKTTHYFMWIEFGNPNSFLEIYFSIAWKIESNS